MGESKKKMKVKNDTLFIGKVTKGKMGIYFQMKPYVYTLGNVKLLIETVHLMTRVVSSCQIGHTFS